MRRARKRGHSGHVDGSRRTRTYAAHETETGRRGRLPGTKKPTASGGAPRFGYSGHVDGSRRSRTYAAHETETGRRRRLPGTKKPTASGGAPRFGYSGHVDGSRRTRTYAAHETETGRRRRLPGTKKPTASGGAPGRTSGAQHAIPLRKHGHMWTCATHGNRQARTTAGHKENPPQAVGHPVHLSSLFPQSAESQLSM
jgi:hypothetical protein